MLSGPEPGRQWHVLLVYFACVVLWGLSVDHPEAPLQRFAVLKWVSALVISVLALAVTLRARGRIDVRGLNLPLLLLVACVVGSSLRNQSSGLLTLGWLVIYLKYVLFLVYLDNLPVSRETALSLLRAISLFAVFLVVEGFVRTALGLYGHPDQISFVLGPHGHFLVGFICSIGICCISAYAFVKRRWHYLLLCLALASISIPGEIKALTIGGPLLVVVVYFAYMRGMRLRVPYAGYLVKSVLAAGLLYGLFLGYQRVSRPDDSQNMMTLAQNFKTWISEGGSVSEARLSRVSTIAVVAAYLEQDKIDLAFGLGPGTTFAVANETRQAIIGPHSWNQIGMVLADVGVVGLALYVWMLVFLALPAWRMIKHLRRVDDRNQVLILSFFGISVFFIALAPMYDLVWRYDAVGYVFFVLNSALYRLGEEMQEQAVPRPVPREPFRCPAGVPGTALGRLGVLRG